LLLLKSNGLISRIYLNLEILNVLKKFKHPLIFITHLHIHPHYLLLKPFLGLHQLLITVPQAVIVIYILFVKHEISIRGAILHHLGRGTLIVNIEYIILALILLDPGAGSLIYLETRGRTDSIGLEHLEEAEGHIFILFDLHLKLLSGCYSDSFRALLELLFNGLVTSILIIDYFS
jgi:hypothetical protein